MTIHKVMYAERTFSLAFVNTTRFSEDVVGESAPCHDGQQDPLLKDDKIVPCHRSFYRIH
jgi:hypothetical protein